MPIKAVIPVHLYGQVADMDAIRKLAERHDLLVIEDACQAHGAEHFSEGWWRRAGSIRKGRRIQFLSRQEPGRLRGGRGGDDRRRGSRAQGEDAPRPRAVRKYHHDLEGYNGRLDAIQAGFLRVKLRHLETWTSERRSAAARYQELLSAVPRLRESVVVPTEPAWSKAVYHLYVIRTSDGTCWRNI